MTLNGNDGDDDDHDGRSSSTISTWHEEAHWMSFRLAVQQFASIKLGDTLSSSIIHEEETEDDETTPRMVAACPTNNAETTNVLTDLAETKMRLALAQAERDELEFTLLQRQSPRATWT